jgi:hypothetical protein
MNAGSFKISVILVKQFLGHMEKSMYGLNIKSKIMCIEHIMKGYGE